MAAPDLPQAALGAPQDFLAAARPQDLLYWVLSVGDGDTQLLILPALPDGRRPGLIVDVIRHAKLAKLLGDLQVRELWDPGYWHTSGAFNP